MKECVHNIATNECSIAIDMRSSFILARAPPTSDYLIGSEEALLEDGWIESTTKAPHVSDIDCLEVSNWIN